LADADIARLRDQGLDDRAIHDLIQVIAYFSYINRVADGLGIGPEAWLPPIGGT
jgi:alkylhydroperoxidase family enzyme